MPRQRDNWGIPGRHPAQPLHPATATSTPDCDGEGEPAARERRVRPTGSERGLRVASAGQGDGTSRRGCPRPGCSEPPSSEGGQGGRVADTGGPCTFCDEDLDNSTGDPGDAEMPVPVRGSHGGFVRTRCMWGHVERLASGHADPQRCVTCRSECPVRNRPLLRQSWPRGCSGSSRRGDDRQWRVPCSSPISFRRMFPS